MVNETRILQGRRITDCDVSGIPRLIAEHPQAHRTELSQLLCRVWDWKNERGQLKDMAARSLLLKLHEGGEIGLPAARRGPPSARRGRTPPAPSDSRPGAGKPTGQP